MEIYNTKDAAITYNAENNVSIHTINDYLNSNSLRKFQTDFITICRDLIASKIIFNAKKQQAIRTVDLEWMKHYVIPCMITSNVKYFAIVMPENAFGRLAMRSFADTANEITVNLFEDLISAKYWISNCTN